MEVFGSSGVRGVVGEDLRPADAVAVAAAAGSVWGEGRVAVGRDTRLTGEMLADAAASGLASVGLDVDRLGQIPTPGLQAYAEREGVYGLMITASHNPPQYNGVKLVGADGIELSTGDLDLELWSPRLGIADARRRRAGGVGPAAAGRRQALRPSPPLEEAVLRAPALAPAAPLREPLL